MYETSRCSGRYPYVNYTESDHDFMMHDDTFFGVANKYFNGYGNLNSGRVEVVFKTNGGYYSKELDYITEQLQDFKEQFEAKREEYIEEKRTVANGIEIDTNDKTVDLLFDNNEKANAFRKKVMDFMKHNSSNGIQVGKMIEMCGLENFMTVNRDMYVKASDVANTEIYASRAIFNYHMREE